MGTIVSIQFLAFFDQIVKYLRKVNFELIFFTPRGEIEEKKDWIASISFIYDKIKPFWRKNISTNFDELLDTLCDLHSLCRVETRHERHHNIFDFVYQKAAFWWRFNYRGIAGGKSWRRVVHTRDQTPKLVYTEVQKVYFKITGAIFDLEI